MKSKMVQAVTWTLVAAMAVTGLYVGFAAPPTPAQRAIPAQPRPTPPPAAEPLAAPAAAPAPPAEAPAPSAPAAAPTLVRVDRPEELGDSNSPVIVGLHGRGDMAVGFAGLAAPLGSAGADGVALAWRGLQGPYSFGSGASWFTGDRKQPIGLSESVAAVAAELRALRQQGRKVGLFGFSQGCMMIAHLVLTAPEAIDGAVCIGGAVIGELPTPPPGSALPPMLLVAGTSDAVVLIADQRALVTALQAAGVATETIEHPGGHRIPGESLAAIRRWIRARVSTPPEGAR